MYMYVNVCYAVCVCCRVCAPQRGEKVSGLAARQKVKLGRILDQVHNDIITERQTGTLCTKHTVYMYNVHVQVRIYMYTMPW